MKLAVWMGLLALMVSAAREGVCAKGGELGNAFIPFASVMDGYSLEYNKKWHLNDLSLATNFSDSEARSGAPVSFFSVSAIHNPDISTIPQMLEHLELQNPGVKWISTKLAGLRGIESELKGVRTIFLLRGPGDLLSIRFRSTDGERTDNVIQYMLSSFRAE